MHITDIATASRRQAPVPGGPVAALLTPTGLSEQVAVIHLEIPAGGGIPEHDHGPSQVVLVPLAGAIEVHQGGQTWTLSTGTTAHIGTGERVRLANPNAEPARVVVVASPAQFAEHVATWPVAS
jgi:quercetin dioxygenase-like cupin family protein